MTDTAPEPSTSTSAAAIAAPVPADSTASTSANPKALPPKRRNKSRRKTRRRDGSDSDASSESSPESAVENADNKAKGKGKAKQKPLFPEASATTPLVWADADVSQNEVVSFDFGGSSNKNAKPTKPQREFTDEQKKRHEEKLRAKKERQKAKRKAAKEAKMKDAKDGEPKEDSHTEKVSSPSKASSPSKRETQTEDASLAASTSALTLDDSKPSSSSPPAPTPTSAPSTSPSSSTPAAPATSGPIVRPIQPFPHRPLRDRLSHPNENRFASRPPHWANDQRQNVRPMPDFWRGRGGPRGMPRGVPRGFFRGRGRGGFGPFGPGGPHFRPPFRPQGPPHGPPNAANAATTNTIANAPPANAPTAPRAMVEAAAVTAANSTSEQPDTTDDAQEPEQQPKPQLQASTQPQAQLSQQPPVPPHQQHRFRPNMPRPDGRWGHDGFHQHMREDAFRANRGMRARGRGRGFAPRGGFRPFFNHAGHLPTPEVSPDRAEKPAAKSSESTSIEALLDDSGAVTVRLPGETETVAVDTRVDTRPPSQPVDLSSQSPRPAAFVPSNPSPGPYSDAGSMSSSGYVGPIPAEYYAGGPPSFRPPPNAMYGRNMNQSFTPEPFQPGHMSHPSHHSRGSFSGPGFFSGSPIPAMDPRAGSPFNPYAANFVMPQHSFKPDVQAGIEVGVPKSPHSEGTDSIPGQIQTPEGFVTGMAPAAGYYAYNPYADGQVFYPQGYWPQQGFDQGMYGYEGDFIHQHQHQHPGF